MKKLFLTLLTMPTVVGVFLPLTMHSTAQATQSNKATTTAQPTGTKPNSIDTLKVDGRNICVSQHGKVYCVAQTRRDPKLTAKAREIGANYEAGVVFTDEESDAAANKFGCDCPACIRAIKQIRVFTQAN
jgi:uncharacterized secreted protein with C-terminal beta-propeller domain